MRDHPGRTEEVLQVRAADAKHAVADLDGSELALGDELADEEVGDGELVGGLGDRQVGGRAPKAGWALRGRAGTPASSPGRA